MYVAVTLAIFGQGVLFGDIRLIAYEVLVWGGFHAFVVACEEPNPRDFWDGVRSLLRPCPSMAPSPTSLARGAQCEQVATEISRNTPISLERICFNHDPAGSYATQTQPEGMSPHRRKNGHYQLLWVVFPQEVRDRAPVAVRIDEG